MSTTMLDLDPGTPRGLCIHVYMYVRTNLESYTQVPSVAVNVKRLLEVVKPDKVSILTQGRIVRTGGPELAIELENEGYDAVMADA